LPGSIWRSGIAIQPSKPLQSQIDYDGKA